LQANHHVWIDEIDLIVFEGLSSIGADKPAGVDHHLIDLEPMGAIDQTLGPDRHWQEISAW
jgi:hypothetical protein